MKGMTINNLQWAEIDYRQAKLEHIKKGTEESLRRAVVAWGVLEKARWLMGTRP
jgi:hypothetical protein